MLYNDEYTEKVNRINGSMMTGMIYEPPLKRRKYNNNNGDNDRNKIVEEEEDEVDLHEFLQKYGGDEVEKIVMKQVQKLKEENKRLKNKYDKILNEFSEYRENHKGCKDKIDEMKKNLDGLKKKNIHYQQEYFKAIGNEKDLKNKLKDEIQLQQRIKIITESNIAKDKEMEGYKNKINEYKKSEKKLNENVKTWMKDIGKKTQQLMMEKNGKIQELQNECNTAKNEINVLIEEKEETMKGIKDRKEENQILINKNNELENELKQYRSVENETFTFRDLMQMHLHNKSEAV